MQMFLKIQICKTYGSLTADEAKHANRRKTEMEVTRTGSKVGNCFYLAPLQVFAWDIDVYITSSNDEFFLYFMFIIDFSDYLKKF